MPFLLDHLWQSTLLALAVGLVVLALRKAPASARHGLWFAASLKFLIPFAALTALGRLAAPRLPALASHAPVHTTSPAAFPDVALIERAAQPLARFPLARFTPEPAPPVLQAPIAPAGPGPAVQLVHHAAVHLDPAMILLAIWALGFAAVLVRWVVHWGKVRAALRAARPLDWSAPMPVLSSATLLGPGLVGFLRPVLVIPESLPERLTRTQIDALLMHEACHLRRRDNLTAALHTLVEAVFWFHPLVWWIGTRLISERESACDEAVVRAGHDRQSYARSLVECARLYVQSPLTCVAGASGSVLKARVEAILTAPPTSSLTGATKALLLAAGACAFATPVAAGLLTPQVREAAAPLAKAVAAISAPARLFPSAPAAATPDVASAAADQDRAPARIVLAQNTSVVRPSQSVASPDTAPVRLSQNLAALELPSAPVRTPAAVLADPRQDALDFVRSYAAYGPKREMVALWTSPICLRVVGLQAEQVAAVGARFEEVAQGLGLEVGLQDANAKVQRGCLGGNVNVEVGFTNDPQATLDDVVKHHRVLLGDRATAATTVTQPIQAWYVTNGVDLAMNEAKPGVPRDPGGEANGLKVPVVYQFIVPAGSPSSSPVGEAAVRNQGSAPGPAPFNAPISAFEASPRGFRNVVVIVDGRRVETQKLGAIADYVAMIVLAQPRALDRCQALPSITDLFAGSCPGRAAPTGLTPADNAYLSALYLNRAKANSGSAPRMTVSSRKSIGSIPQSDLADRMALILASPGVVADAGAARHASPANFQEHPSGRGF
jgi:beta-lactamase regulating signal transducer with metallopeptidase domain